MLAISIYGFLSLCNVTITDSYFGDGTPGTNCFGGSDCISDSRNLIASIAPSENIIVSITSKEYVNYNVYSSYSDDTPRYLSCYNMQEKTFICEGLSNLLKIRTQYVWDISNIQIQEECRTSAIGSASEDTTFIVIIVLCVTCFLASFVTYGRWRYRRARKTVAKKEHVISSASATRIVINSETESTPHEKQNRVENKTFKPTQVRRDPRNQQIRSSAPLKERPVSQRVTSEFPRRVASDVPRRTSSEQYGRSRSAEPIRQPSAHSGNVARRSQSVRSSRHNSRPRSSHRLGTGSR